MARLADYHFDEWQLFWSSTLLTGLPEYEYFKTEQEARQHAETILKARVGTFEDVGSGQYAPGHFSQYIYCRIYQMLSRLEILNEKRLHLAELQSSIDRLNQEIAELEAPVPFDPDRRYERRPLDAPDPEFPRKTHDWFPTDK